MEFFRRAPGEPRSVGVFPGTFNPPTLAHLALAQAGLACVDEVVFVLPRELPHKTYEGVGFADRLRMLETALAREPRFSIAATPRGLFIEIARECRQAYGPEAELYFLCGRDAAERIANWTYEKPGAFLDQLREYRMLVAPRQGQYTPPEEYGSRIRPLVLDEGYDALSATGVRNRIANGEPWEHLVPESIVEMVRDIYKPPPERLI